MDLERDRYVDRFYCGDSDEVNRETNKIFKTDSQWFENSISYEVNLVSISTIVKIVEVNKKVAQGVQLKWGSGWFIFVSAPKGLVTCGAIDDKTLQEFGIAAARVKGTPELPINSIEDLLERSVTDVNVEAESLGIRIGMLAKEALEILF